MCYIITMADCNKSVYHLLKIEKEHHSMLSGVLFHWYVVIGIGNGGRELSGKGRVIFL